jgi:hypothetical protein
MVKLLRGRWHLADQAGTQELEQRQRTLDGPSQIGISTPHEAAPLGNAFQTLRRDHSPGGYVKCCRSDESFCPCVWDSQAVYCKNPVFCSKPGIHAGKLRPDSFPRGGCESTGPLSIALLGIMLFRESEELMIQGNPYLRGREAKYRRQVEEQDVQRWRLAKLARPRSRPWLQVRARLVDLANAGIQRVSRWLAQPSEPQEQCC